MLLKRSFHFALSLYTTNSLISRAISTSGVLFNKMMRAADIGDGSVDNMKLSEVTIPQLRAGEVLIKVHSSAINRADTLQRRGKYPPPKGASDILGLEAAGEVAELHESCAGSWTKGDRVMALVAGGGNAEYVAADHRHLMTIPKSLSMLEAGGIPEVWLTAYQLLHIVGSLQPSDAVLIHAGASGVGTAAIQLVKLAGAKSYITAGSEEKIKFAKSLGATDGFNYKTDDWSGALLKATDGRGVNLILDCVGGSHWQKNTDVIAMDGRWVLYGLMGGADVEGPLLRKLLSKRVALLATTMRGRSNDYKAMMVSEFSNNALSHFDDMKLKPIVETVFDFKDIGKAHELMESNKTTGKILLKVLDDKPSGKEEL